MSELKSATLYISYHLDVYKIENTKTNYRHEYGNEYSKNKPQQKNYFPKYNPHLKGFYRLELWEDEQRDKFLENRKKNYKFNTKTRGYIKKCRSSEIYLPVCRLEIKWGYCWNYYPKLLSKLVKMCTNNKSLLFGLKNKDPLISNFAINVFKYKNIKIVDDSKDVVKVSIPFSIEEYVPISIDKLAIEDKMFKYSIKKEIQLLENAQRENRLNEAGHFRLNELRCKLMDIEFEGYDKETFDEVDDNIKNYIEDKEESKIEDDNIDSEFRDKLKGV